uniref:glutathione S-transferase N-terminal domain-containing protein n=1 Tax=uncultured Shimia sp. TaxID=573152 RepID=UPI0025E3BB6F
MTDPAAAQVTVFGFGESIYTQVAMMTLAAKGVAFALQHEDPFETTDAGSHPFGRVPVLRHGDFVVYETAAITRYVDR